MLLAGESAKVRQRVVDYCDGWMPQAKANPDILGGIADLRARAIEAGRSPDSVSITVFGAPAERELLDRYEAAGVQRVVLGLPAADRDTVLPLLESHAKLLRR